MCWGKGTIWNLEEGVGTCIPLGWLQPSRWVKNALAIVVQCLRESGAFLVSDLGLENGMASGLRRLTILEGTGFQRGWEERA